MAELSYYLKNYNRYLLAEKGNLHNKSSKFSLSTLYKNDDNNNQKLYNLLLNHYKTMIYYMKLLERND